MRVRAVGIAAVLTLRDVAPGGFCTWSEYDFAAEEQREFRFWLHRSTTVSLLADAVYSLRTKGGRYRTGWRFVDVARSHDEIAQLLDAVTSR